MKITHNKIGQNLNLSDLNKADQTDLAKKAGGTSQGSSQQNIVDRIESSSARIQLSDRAQEAKKIKELALATPDVDMAKVEKFRKLIDEGKYIVDSKAVADRMVDEHLSTGD
jgi:negative regulator of flagellin synthesis FlgM